MPQIPPYEVLSNFRHNSALYVALMSELKERIQVGQGAIINAYPLPRAVSVELCFLQLRKICELIALACLAAHGDLAKPTWIEKHWNADKILNGLDQLDRRCYPQAQRQVVDPATKTLLEFVDQPEPFLAKRELISVYYRCNDFLHKGKLDDYRRSLNPRYEIYEVLDIFGRMKKLLGTHKIMTSDPGWFWMCTLNYPPDDTVYLALFCNIGEYDPILPNS